MWQEKIEIEPPYDFDRVLERFSMDPLNVIDSEKRLVKVPLYINKEPVVTEIQSIGTKDRPSFLITGNNDEVKDEIIERLATIFQWNVPLQQIQHHFANTNIESIFEAHEGTPLMLDNDPYSCLMKCIIHQQLNMAFAITLTERFVKTFGREVDGVWFYPLPEEVAKLSYDELKALQFSGRKAEYVIDTSKLLADGTLDVQQLTQMSDEEITKTLVKIRGIGPWTAQNFLLFGLGRQNLFPKADIGIQNAIKKLFGLEQKPTSEQMDEFSKSWSPYLSYATLYLWRSIE